MADSNIISYVDEVYRKLAEQRKNHEEAYLNSLYDSVPGIREIDEEISLLPLRCANMVIKDGITADEALSVMERKRDELRARRNNLVRNAGVEEYKPLPYRCPYCRDTGIADGRQCSCAKKIVREHMIENARKISHFSCDIEDDTFEKFRFDYYGKDIIQKFGMSPYDNIKSVYSICRKYCENFGKNSQNLFFNGSSGLGKTYLANCITNELLGAGHTVVYQSSARMFQFLEDYKFGRVDRDEYEAYANSIYDSELLIIDDLGTEFVTSYTNSVFFDLLNTRLLNNKKTIISTNTSVRDIEKKYTERVSSRILGEFKILYFIGDDIRRKKAGGI